jgi:hypothetical protein
LVARPRFCLCVRRTHGPSGIPSLARAQRRDSLDLPLLRFDSPTRCFPKSPPPTSRSKAPLLGFSAPSALMGNESPRPSRFPGPAPRRFLAGNPPAGPTPPATVPLTGFPNLSAVSSSPRRPAIFRRVAFVGFCPSGSCSFHEAPTARRRRLCPLDVAPIGLIGSPS